MTRLFDENDKYTPDAIALDREFTKAVEPIILEWYKKGHSIRDIQLIAEGAVLDRCLLTLLSAQDELRKK